MRACILVCIMILVTCVGFEPIISYFIPFIFALSSLGDIRRADAECNKSNIEKSDLRSVQENLNLHCKFLPSSFPAWRYVPLFPCH